MSIENALSKFCNASFFGAGAGVMCTSAVSSTDVAAGSEKASNPLLPFGASAMTGAGIPSPVVGGWRIYFWPWKAK